MKLETFQAKPIGVSKKKNESVQRLISRFKKEVGESNILIDYKERLVYEKPSVKKRRAKKKARLLMKKQRTEKKKSF